MWYEGKKRLIILLLIAMLVVSLCSPVLATENDECQCGEHHHEIPNLMISHDRLPCGHIPESYFLNSDECVQCFEARIVAEQLSSSRSGIGGIAEPRGSICSNCGRSTVSIICADSNLIYSYNYQQGTSYLCSGCRSDAAANDIPVCNSPCYVLQYMSYSKKHCNYCGYESYVFNSSGTGLAKHYCGVYDYCSGNSYYIYCDLRGDWYNV